MCSRIDEHSKIKERLMGLIDTATTGALLAAEALLQRAQQHPDLELRSRENLAVKDGSYWSQREQIITMLLATVPRLGQTSPFGLLAKDVLRNIASFVPWGRCDVRFLDPGFGQLSPDGRLIKISEEEWSSRGVPHLAITQPIQCRCIEYIELMLSDVWCGSEIIVHQVTLEMDVQEGVGEGPEKGEIKVNDEHVTSWDHVWKNQPPASIIVGILLDLTRGTVSWRLNGVNGPRVFLGDGWESGVLIRLGGDFPESDGEPSGWRAEISCPATVPDDLHNINDIHGFSTCHH